MKTPGHPYYGNAWTWPWIGRPVAHYYQSTGSGSKQLDSEILGLPNPMIWWPGFFIGFIAPENYVSTMTFQVWAMLIIGGSGNNRGALLGAVLVWALWSVTGAVLAAFVPGEYQARAAALQIVLIGGALAALLVLRPRGILGEEKMISRFLNE